MKRLLWIWMLLCVVRGWSVDVEVFADVLYWEAGQEGTENWGQVLDVAGKRGHVDVLDVELGWNWGVRVGARFDLGCGDWDMRCHVTHYDVTGSRYVASDSWIGSAFIGNFYFDNLFGLGFSGPQYHRAAIAWSLDFYAAAWELGKSFCLGSGVRCRPFIGVMGGSVDQDIKTAWADPNQTNFTKGWEELKNHFRGVGPCFGVDTTWLLVDTECVGWHLFGDVSGGLLWGSWKLSDLYFNNAPGAIPVPQNTLHGAAPVIRLMAGMEWVWGGSVMRLGYEAQYWLSQLQLYSFNMGRMNGHLILQGGTAEFSFNF